MAHDAGIIVRGSALVITSDELIMHAVLDAENGITLMGSDTPQRLEYKPGNTCSMSLSGDDEGRLRRYFEKLAEGGTVTMPLEKAVWGDLFGMCADRFGVSWLVNVTSGAPPQAP